MAQRIMQYQAAMQLAQSAPEMYDLKELHRQMLEVLGIQDVDDVIPSEDDIPPVDPVSAVQNLINNKPVKAYEFQDHDAHIGTIAAAQDNPEIQAILGQSPNAQSILASASSYVNDHLTMKFRDQVEKEMGVALPPIGEPIPADVEKRISELVAQAAQRVTQRAMQEAEQSRIAEEQQDPLIQMKEREIAAKEADIQRKSMGDQARFQLAGQKQMAQQQLEAQRLELERQKIAIEAQLEETKLQAQIASELQESERASSEQAVEDFKTGLDIAKDIIKDST